MVPCGTKGCALKVPERIEFGRGEIPNCIVWRDSFLAEELGQTVVFLGQASIQVELVLDLQYRFAQCRHIIAGQVDTELGVDHVDQRRETLRNIQSREGNEQTHT